MPRFRFYIAMALAACTSMPAQAQAEEPYKLIITWYQHGIAITDYPSQERCERAAQVVNERMAARAITSGLPAEAGEIAFCIPG